MGLTQDQTGWVMAAASGIACVLGASVICVDIVVRQFPGMRDWKLQNSDKFLSISLSLSFGVMLFSSLYSMLPSSKTSLVKGGYSPKEATWIMVGCFFGGIIGIQFLSKLLHKYVPHQAIDCEHSHDDEAQKESDDAHEHEHEHERDHGHDHDGVLEHTHSQQSQPRPNGRSKSRASRRLSQRPRRETNKRPTLQSSITGTFSKLTSGKNSSCACEGPCYGYSDLCQSDCFQSVNARGGTKAPKPTTGVNRPSAVRNATTTESTPLLHDPDEHVSTRPHTRAVTEGTCSRPDLDLEHGPSEDSSATAFDSDRHDFHKAHSQYSVASSDEAHLAESHHHHVPENAFLSIGLQTSIAIALHKLPEGFITYATNHANPKLGVSVFLALFFHNITEGFALALPLYLALGNRTKAMVISFALGGLSQPLGAGIAALWFKLAGDSNWAPNEAGYGGIFAVTAGIMASVALQLFSESLDMTHSKDLCMIGAIFGMGILGVSNALTA